MKITFFDVDPLDAQRMMDGLFGTKKAQTAGTPIIPDDSEPAPKRERDPEPEVLRPARRRRRTKAEMAEARAQERTAEEGATEEGPASQGEEDPPIQDEPVRRRRRRAAEPDPTDARPAGRRRRSRRGGRQESPTSADDSQSENPVDSPISADDEITDRDVAKAASEGAQAVGPDAVKEILGQFGVSNVADLDQVQRREFIDLIDEAIEDAIHDAG